jgi:hypothetical protein
MRRSLFPAALLAVGLGLLLPPSPAAARPKDEEKTRGKPRSLAAFPGYKRQRIQGFTLLISNAVYRANEDERWKRKPLDVLDLELGTIARRLPEAGVNLLRRLLIWVEWEDRSDPDFARRIVAKYYGVYGNVRLWSLGKGKHPLKANNIEIINMRSLTREHQPGSKLERCVLLHEMAHAVHDKLLRARNPAIRSAYQQAMARGLYKEAKDVFGKIRKRPYASVNEREYFAELTCAYLDKLHYHPFNAEGLKEHDPVGYRVMELCWGKREVLDRALAAKVEREASRLLAAANKLRAGEKKAALEKIIDRFPDTKAAAEAKKLLEPKEEKAG